MNKDFLPFTRPSIDEATIAGVAEVLRSGWITTGPNAKAFETALSRVPVSIAYPMLSIGYIVNAVAAWYLFGEALSAMKLAGIGVIVLGVFMVARS